MTKFIRLPEVMALTGLSRSGIYAAIAEGAFPAQIPLGMRAVAWDSESVERFMEERVAAAIDHASIHINKAAEETGNDSYRYKNSTINREKEKKSSKTP